MSDRPRKSKPASVPLTGLWQAFDAARFGADRILNLRESLPTADEAARRAELWLRQKQVEQAEQVLVITGRGNNSEGGVSRVREAIIRTLHTLKRGNVVAGHAEHTAGSFVVTLAPISALVEAPKRRRETPPPPPAPPSLDALDEETRYLLRGLAENALDHLGVRDRGAFLEAEMLRQFGVLAAAVPPGPDRERRLRDAIRRAMDEY
jgi:hypothetical protein